MDFQLTGTIHEIYPSQQKTEKFKSREFVLKVSKEIGEREITDYVKFQTTQDKCEVLDKYKVGNTVTAHFNIRGREWEKDGKKSYFTNLDAWRIEGSQQTNDTPVTYQAKQSAPAEDDFNDGLPF